MFFVFRVLPTKKYGQNYNDYIDCVVVFALYLKYSSRPKYYKGGYKKLTEIEILTTSVGEFVMMEIEAVKEVVYDKGNDKLTAFTVYMKNGNKYSLAIKEVA